MRRLHAGAETEAGVIPHPGYGHRDTCQCGATGCPEVCVQIRSGRFFGPKVEPPEPRNRQERRSRAAEGRGKGCTA